MDGGGMRGPTLDDAIAVLAKLAGMTPDTITVGEFLINADSSWGQLLEPRVCSFRHSPRIIREAESLLHTYTQIEGMAARMKRPPYRNPARPSAPTA
jgi:hypothetical protein